MNIIKRNNVFTIILSLSCSLTFAQTTSFNKDAGCVIEKVENPPNLSNVKGYDALIKSKYHMAVLRIHLYGESEIQISAFQLINNQDKWYYKDIKKSNNLIPEKSNAELSKFPYQSFDKEIHLVNYCKSTNVQHSFSSFVYLLIIDNKVTMSLASNTPVTNVNNSEYKNILDFFRAEELLVK